MLGESENQFTLTRAAPSTRGRKQARFSQSSNYLRGIVLGLRISLFLFLLVVSIFGATAAAFNEGWEAAPFGTFTPTGSTLIVADEGSWYLGDTVSHFPDCGPTPQRAEILLHGGTKALRLTSGTNSGGCADNVWVELRDFGGVYNPGFSVPLTNKTIITFEESGELDDPQFHGAGRNCIDPPCFDNVSLLLTDNRGNMLAYVIQRDPEATPNVPNINYGDTYREVFLDPQAASYSRNLYQDFLTIPAFSTANPSVVSIAVKVDEHGWAIIDNISVGDALPYLNHVRSGNNIVLSWSTNLTGFALEHTTGLPATTWTAATPLPAVVNGHYTVTNAMSDSTRFYRLKR